MLPELLALHLGHEVLFGLLNPLLVLLVEHLSRYYERLLHVLVGLRRRLDEELDALVPAELLALVTGHLSFSVSVHLVADEHDDCIWLALRLYLVEPVLQVLEAGVARYAVGEEHCVGPAVEDLGDRLEGLLPCRVPDLQLEDGLLHLYEQGAELHAHRDLVVLAELVGRHSVHEAGLPHA